MTISRRGRERRGANTIVLLGILAQSAWSPQALAQATGSGQPAAWRYTDGSGRQVFVGSYGQVPEAARGSAVAVGAGAAHTVLPSPPMPAERAAGARPNELLAYRDGHGELHVVRSAEAVPTARRHTLRTISRADLREDPVLAAKLRGMLAGRRKALLESPPCQRALDMQGQPWWRRLLHEHGALLTIAGILLGLLWISPRMMRWIGAPAWGRTLTFSVQVLGFLGLMVYALVGTRRAYQRFAPLMGSCDEVSAQSPLVTAAEGLWERAGALDRLERRIADLESHRAVQQDPGLH